MMHKRLSPAAGRAALIERASHVENSGAMNWKRIQKPLIVGGAIALIAIAGTGHFVVRELLAAFLFFCVLFGLLGISVLGSFLLGEGVVRCFNLLETSVASFRLHPPIPSVAGPLAREIGKSYLSSKRTGSGALCSNQRKYEQSDQGAR